jgi:hypothetical protein
MGSQCLKHLRLLIHCRAVPKTAAAKRHYLGGTDGLTERETKTRLIETYNQVAPSQKRVHLKS